MTGKPSRIDVPTDQELHQLRKLACGGVIDFSPVCANQRIGTPGKTPMRPIADSVARRFERRGWIKTGKRDCAIITAAGKAAIKRKEYRPRKQRSCK